MRLLLRDVAHVIFGSLSRSNFFWPPTPIGGAPLTPCIAWDKLTLYIIYAKCVYNPDIGIKPAEPETVL